jgi:hypothetical protein
VIPVKHVTTVSNDDIYVLDANCQLECAFCVEGITKRQRRLRWRWLLAAEPLIVSLERLWRGLRRVTQPVTAWGREGRDARRSAAILTELEAVLGQIPREEVLLAAHDILELDRLFDALDLCARLQKRVALITPGLRLADPDFARRLAPRICRITLTYLSDDPKTYHKLTGHPEAHHLVRQAILNLVALQVPLAINFIVTRLNHRDLLGVAAFLLDQVGLKTFTLVCFVPEPLPLEMDPTLPDLFVPFPELDAELGRFVARYRGTRKRLGLVNVPPCRLSEAVLASDNIHLSPAGQDDGLVRRHRDARCAGCAFGEHCPRVFEAYHARYPHEPFDAEKVNRHLPQIRS